MAMRSATLISATHLCLLVLVGGAISASAAMPFSLLANNPHRKTIALAIFTLGCVITIASDLCLSYSIKHNQFADAEVERLRSNTSSALWKVLHGSAWLIAVIFQSIALLFNGPHSLLQVGWIALMFSSTLTMVKSSVGRASEVQSPPPAPSAPLTSSHWGQ